MARASVAQAAEYGEPQRNYELAEDHLQAGRLVEAATHFKACLRLPEQVSPDLMADAYAGWLEALIALGDRRAVDRVSRRAEATNSLSPLTRELLAAHYEKYGRPTEARRQAKRALDDLASEFVQLSPEYQFGIALLGIRLAVAYAPSAVGPYLDRATASAPDDLDAHVALLESRLAAAGLLGVVVPDDLGELDSVLARQDWQAAYDISMRSSLAGLAPLAPRSTWQPVCATAAPRRPRLMC